MPVEYEPIAGRYATLELDGRPCRLFFEEAGQGIPILCLHTAGADSRQYRHLMLDEAVTAHYRVIAFDMPWHGKSFPPPGYQDEEYRLTTDAYTGAILAVVDALEARPAGADGLLDRRADRARLRRPSRRAVPRPDRPPGGRSPDAVVRRVLVAPARRARAARSAPR